MAAAISTNGVLKVELWPPSTTERATRFIINLAIPELRRERWYCNSKINIRRNRMVIVTAKQPSSTFHGGKAPAISGHHQTDLVDISQLLFVGHTSKISLSVEDLDQVHQISTHPWCSCLILTLWIWIWQRRDLSSRYTMSCNYVTSSRSRSGIQIPVPRYGMSMPGYKVTP